MCREGGNYLPECDRTGQQQVNRSDGRGLGGLGSSKIAAHAILSFTEAVKTPSNRSNKDIVYIKKKRGKVM